MESAVRVDGFGPNDWQATFFVCRTKLVFVSVPHQLSRGDIEAVIGEPVGHGIEPFDQNRLVWQAGEQPGSAGNAIKSCAANALDKERFRRGVRAQKTNFNTRLRIVGLSSEHGERGFLQDAVENCVAITHEIEPLQGGLVGKKFAQVLKVLPSKE